MAVVQYYLKDRQFADLVDRAERLGLSAGQLARVLALSSEAGDGELLRIHREQQRKDSKRVPKIGT